MPCSDRMAIRLTVQSRGRLPWPDDRRSPLTEPKPPWTREGEALVGEWKFADFAEALAFVNKVGEASEAAKHHPDISIKWNRVRLTLSTHDAGKVTKKDFDLAETISAL